MADGPVIHLGENSPEHVAYRLLTHIASVERKGIAHSNSASGPSLADRQWILDTYAECLLTVLSPAKRTRQ